mgnify:CR=1 FL=1
MGSQGCATMGRRSPHARGFPLVELLIALSLFALMSAVLFGSLRLAGRTWDAGEAKAEATSGMRLAGDYLRTGLDGVEFHATPRPRWESLHDLQGLFEMWRITGEAKYRESFEHHCRMNLRGEGHNAASVSGGERATGNPGATGSHCAQFFEKI